MNSLIQRKMIINFTVRCLQPNYGYYRAQINYALNIKLTISCLNTSFGMRKINMRMLSCCKRPIYKSSANLFYTHSGKVLYMINCINKLCINSRQYRQENFQISTLSKHNKKAMWTKIQLLQACLITLFYQTWSCLVTLRD